MQRRLLGAHAGVAADEVQLAHRHIQRGLVGVLEVQEFGRAFAAARQVNRHQPVVAANAVAGVHDRIADLELR